MVIHTYGNREDKVILLLHPMGFTGKEMTDHFLPHLKGRYYFDWGSREDYYKTSTPLVRKLYPGATVIIRENYAHCEYMAKYPEDYISFIEAHIG